MRLNYTKHDKKIICFDFDETIYQNEQVRDDAVELLRWCRQRGLYIIINSCRQTIDYGSVYDLLTRVEAPYDQISLSAKPVADLYIDDKSLYMDYQLLRNFIDIYFSDSADEVITNIASGQLDSDFMQNIKNVPENDSQKDTNSKADDFIVYLPISGGMDSITMWNMLEEDGVKYQMYYFDFGQEYAKQEIEVIRKIIKPTYGQFNVIEVPLKFRAFKHILTGRNAIITLLLAKIMQNSGKWGEIWFGNLQGESPVLGGDKSKRFFNDMASLLPVLGYDCRVVNPLCGIDKFDEVSYWLERNEIETLKSVKSCFSGEYYQCGKCQACFRKFVAFKAYNIDISSQFPYNKYDFKEYVDKYKKVMNEAKANEDYTHYSKARINKTLRVIESNHL